LAQLRGGTSFCTRGAMQDYDVVFYSRVGKNRDTRRECPAGAGPAGWFLPGGFSRKAGPIKHQLVLVCQSGGPARKNQQKPIAYTDLLATGRFKELCFLCN